MPDEEFNIGNALSDLCEAVHDDKFYGTGTPNGKPYDPDIQISEMREKIITAWNTRPQPASNEAMEALDNALKCCNNAIRLGVLGCRQREQAVYVKEYIVSARAALAQEVDYDSITKWASWNCADYENGLTPEAQKLASDIMFSLCDEPTKPPIDIEELKEEAIAQINGTGNYKGSDKLNKTVCDTVDYLATRNMIGGKDIEIEGVSNPASKLLIARQKDNDGQDVVVVAEWYWEEVMVLLSGGKDHKPLVDALREIVAYLDMEYGAQEVDRYSPAARQALKQYEEQEDNKTK